MTDHGNRDTGWIIYFFQSFLILLPKIFSSSGKIAETLLYPSKEKALPKAELLTIAVSQKFQGQGIAQHMFKEFTAQMKKRKAGVIQWITPAFCVSSIQNQTITWAG
jgi:predicted GNAT family acetyltransferase